MASLVGVGIERDASSIMDEQTVATFEPIHALNLVGEERRNPFRL